MLVTNVETEFRLIFVDMAIKPTENGGAKQEKEVVAEIIVNPKIYKMMVKTMKENLEMYEEKFGKIGDMNLEVEKGGISIRDLVENKTDKGYV